MGFGDFIFTTEVKGASILPSPPNLDCVAVIAITTSGMK